MKRPAHRPPLPPEQRLGARYVLRLTAAQRAKLDRLGGATWIRQRIDQA